MATINVQFSVTPALADLLERLFSHPEENRIMGALEDLKTALTTAQTATHDEIARVAEDVDMLVTTLNDATTQIADLQAMIAAGLATQEQLDAANAKIAELESGITDVAAGVSGIAEDLGAVDPLPDNPPATPPAEPPAEPPA